MLVLKNVSKVFHSASRKIQVLFDINLTIDEGSVTAIVGPSGSGKSTLLALAAGLDRSSSGAICFKEFELEKMNENELSVFRNANIGFVFQSFNLIPALTAIENVMVPAELQGRKDARKAALELLARVGLKDRLTHYPAQLSGGEQQRVAIARAYINQPRLLFGDEPTANLDAETASAVESMLFELNKERKSTLVFATHNLELAKRADRIVKLQAGRLL